MKRSELREMIREEIQKLNKAKLSYYIEHWKFPEGKDTGGDLLKTVKLGDKFDQKKFQKKFDTLAHKLNPGEELWFRKNDDRFIGKTLLQVLHRKGKVYVNTNPSGGSPRYKQYKFSY